VLPELQTLLTAVAWLRDQPSDANLAPAIEALRVAWHVIADYCVGVRDHSFQGDAQFGECLAFLEQFLNSRPADASTTQNLQRIRWYRFLFGVLT
jgi:hypothetical protein